jgi:hypothetical protein
MPGALLVGSAEYQLCQTALLRADQRVCEFRVHTVVFEPVRRSARGGWALPAEPDPRPSQHGSVALSLCTSARPLHTRFLNIIGNIISDAIMRPNPTSQPVGGGVGPPADSSMSRQVEGGALRLEVGQIHHGALPLMSTNGRFSHPTNDWRWRTAAPDQDQASMARSMLAPGTTVCTDCRVGSWAAANASTDCRLCAAGRQGSFRRGTSAASCEACQVGRTRASHLWLRDLARINIISDAIISRGLRTGPRSGARPRLAPRRAACALKATTTSGQGRAAMAAAWARIGQPPHPISSHLSHLI